MVNSPNSLELSTLVFNGIERGQKAPRKITSVYGLPFYCSSGVNSHFEGTWFPFFGVTPYRNFSKRPSACGNLPPLFYKLFPPSDNFADNNAELPVRFGSLACLLLSSCFGGGIWVTQNGQALLEHLKITFPHFYCEWPTMMLNEPEKIIEEDKLFDINPWLLAKARLCQPKELSALFPVEIENLSQLQERAQNKGGLKLQGR